MAPLPINNSNASLPAALAHADQTIWLPKPFPWFSPPTPPPIRRGRLIRRLGRRPKEREMTKYYPTDAAVERIGLGLLDRSLPKPEWTHAAHFAATLWLLRHRPDITLSERLPGFIRRYNEATGVENTDTGGYHETITQASIRAARDFLSRYPAERPLHEIADDLMASRLGDKAWLLDYWSPERIHAVEARQAWVEPDLLDLPF